MKTYNEMDKEIVKLLDMEGMPLSVYAARYIEKLQAENAELRARLEKAIELPSGDRVWYIAKDEEGQESYIIPKPTSSLTVEELKYEMDKKYFPTREDAEARLKEIKENVELRERLNNAVELPCEVGDTIYVVFLDEIKEWQVEKIELCKDEYFVYCGHADADDYTFVTSKEYGMRWFTAPEEAEARLKELQGGEK